MIDIYLEVVLDDILKCDVIHSFYHLNSINSQYDPVLKCLEITRIQRRIKKENCQGSRFEGGSVLSEDEANSWM